jgi:hypothetical protein
MGKRKDTKQQIQAAEKGKAKAAKRQARDDAYRADVYVARERARRGDRDAAMPLMRAAVDHLFPGVQQLAWGISATGGLVQTLLDRGAQSDVAEAEAAIERLAAAPTDEGLVLRDIWLCGCARCWPKRVVRRRISDISSSDTARWPHRWATKGTWHGPRRCRDGGGSSEPLAHVGEGVEVLVGDPARSQYDPVACRSTRAPNLPNAVSASTATTRSS